jgi:spoIIIJ-associated protein
MLEQKDLKKIKDAAEEFFSKMTMPVLKTEISLTPAEENREVVNLDIKIDEPQILIGQGGQTLFETQRILRTILNKKMQNIFYLNLDINDYKKKKIEYLKSLAKDIADEVVLTKKEKVLLPMPAYERRIIHEELSHRTDVATESQGDNFDRHIVIKPK